MEVLLNIEARLWAGIMGVPHAESAMKRKERKKEKKRVYDKEVAVLRKMQSCLGSDTGP